MKKKLKKNMVITQKEHEEWHKKHKDYDEKNDKEHKLCHKKIDLTVKKKITTPYKSATGSPYN
ncbi:MAG: hypothetical protein JW778_07090 [Candidatus Altiarchaeota archaeon]|nr:hypothetical protein [Candidatus Altiarchaeota archaeon]